MGFKEYYTLCRNWEKLICTYCDTYWAVVSCMACSPWSFVLLCFLNCFVLISEKKLSACDLYDCFKIVWKLQCPMYDRCTGQNCYSNFTRRDTIASGFGCGLNTDHDLYSPCLSLEDSLIAMCFQKVHFWQGLFVWAMCTT